MAYIMSPTGISSYRDCPRRFYEQYITKFIKWQTSPAIVRGNDVHALVEEAVKVGFDPSANWPEGVNLGYVEQVVNEARAAIDAGAIPTIEHELVVTNKLQPAKDGWWAADAWLRAKADLTLLTDRPLVVDIKTGKKWQSDHLQLRLEALLMHFIYRKTQVDYAYWYVDSGETVTGSCDFTNGLDDVQDIISTIRTLQRAIAENSFFPKRNKFCNWCVLRGTEKCGV